MASKLRVVKDDDPAPDYDPELVDTIREVLRRAEAGDVKSVLILSEDNEGGYASSVYTESALALLTYARLFAEDEVRELMGMIDSGTLH